MLAGKLSQLAYESLKALEMKKGEAKPMKMTLVRHRITDFRIDDKGSGWQATEEPFERDDWSLFLFDFVRDHIATLPIFREIADAIVKDYREIFQSISQDINRKNQAEFWLGNFVRTVLHEKLENRLTEPRLIEIIATFENELNCSPLENRVTSYLSGLHLKPDFITLDESTIIRRLRASDLEYEYYPFTPFPSPRLDLRHPSAVAEINMRIKDQSELWKKLERALVILRLFRLGSIHSLWNDSARNSVLWSSGTGSTWSHSGSTESYSFVVEENETDNLKKFFKSLETLVQYDQSGEGSASLSLALLRYSNALLDPVDAERKLMTAMMGIESLYCVPSDKGETGYRLGLRAAKLLGFLGFDPVDVRINVGRSYYIRNKVAHGLVIDVKRTGNITDLLNNLLQYLRLSLIVFLLIGPAQKNRFVFLIDKSLIDASSSVEVRNQLRKMAEQIPNLPISA